MSLYPTCTWIMLLLVSLVGDSAADATLLDARYLYHHAKLDIT